MPKKQFIYAIFLLLAIGGGFLVLKEYWGTKEFVRETALAPQNTLFANEAQKDGDSDGLKDWEEVLWKTDSKNQDTDGDGTFDGEEVREKRNPLKPGPDDEYKSIEETPLEEVLTENEAEKDLTFTDIFARDFLTGYFALKQGGQWDNETRDRLIKTLMAGIENFPTKEYVLADLAITQKSDKDALRQYGNALGDIAIRYRHLSEQKEADILYDAIKRDAPQKLEALDPIIADYEMLINAYLKVTVPLSAYELHLDALKINEGVKNAIVGMKETFNDPFRASASLQAYRDVSSQSATITKNLKSFFAKNGVVFEYNESGKIFNK